MDKEQKAARAHALLTDELLQDALSEVEGRALTALTNCDPTDAVGLQSASLELRAVKAVVNALQAHIDTHTIEQKKGRHRG